MVILTGSKGRGRFGITAVVSTVVLIGCAAEPDDAQSVLTASDTIAGASSSGKTAHGLTLRSAVRAALADSPELGISDAQLDDARAAIDVAASERGPFVDLTASTGGENTYSEVGDTRGLNRSEINLSVERTVYDFGAIDQGIARRESLASAAEKTRLDTMETVALDTVFAYLNFLRNSQLAAVAAQNTQNHQRIFNLVEQNEAGGNATLADVNRAATRLEAAKSTQLDAQNAREDAIVVFRRLTNLSPAQVQVPSQLAPPERRLTAASRRAAILNNPELLALTSEREALERQLDQQLASRKPRFFVRGQGNLRDDVGGATGRAGDLSAVVGFNIRLYSAGARRAQEAQTRARIREIEETYRATLRDLEEEGEQVDQSLATAAENTAFVNERFTTARDGLALFQTQFEAGERTAFELLDAQRDFFQSQTERIENRFERASNVYQDLRLRGVLVKTLLGPAP